MKGNRRLHIAIPILRESDQMMTLLDCIQGQNFSNFCVYFCINQPDHWWDDDSHISDCIDNEKTFHIIQKKASFDFEIIDKFSKGKGWDKKKSGVGWARKTIYKRILEVANPYDLIVSLDADTTFAPSYFQSIINIFQAHAKNLALSVPYYHKLNGDKIIDRNILRYEIYLRSYFINLSWIDSPYAFTAIGSAMVFPVWAYQKVGGMKPYESGEDFYLMQKFRKSGEIIQCNIETVYPSARFSDRVPFGTGPAMIQGANGDWSKYPIFSLKSFQKIQSFYNILPLLSEKNIPTPLDDFFRFQFGTTDIWDGIRKNSKTKEQFIKKVHQKWDGLRILQFLRYDQEKRSDEEYFLELFKLISSSENTLSFDFSFQTSSVSALNEIRNMLYNYEKQLRCQNIN